VKAFDAQGRTRAAQLVSNSFLARRLQPIGTAGGQSVQQTTIGDREIRAWLVSYFRDPNVAGAQSRQLTAGNAIMAHDKQSVFQVLLGAVVVDQAHGIATLFGHSGHELQVIKLR
jgi:hypothetical protein